jgi:isoleucyl-tRNA synthetase
VSAEAAVDYKTTLNLPRTDFPMKADLPKREPETLARWREMRLYERILEKNRGRPRFTLHDGPPYANGTLHMGHVLNKVLKDIVVRYKNLSGYLSEYVPGWDCHGLPIELAVEKELGPKRREMSPAEVRRTCRAYAARFVDIQREEFVRLGGMGQWDDPYLTMSFAYEARIAQELGRFAAAGSLYRAKMPVFWCASCATALAEAEVEYEDRESPSIYVAFPVRVPSEALRPFEGKLAAAIWTTTPWTLVANLAIAVHPELEYAVIAGRTDDEVLLVASGLAERAAQAMGLGAPRLLSTFSAAELRGTICRHPWIDRDSPILFGSHVTLDAGTGCVHTAPGHGQEDFELGRAHGLEPYAPVDRHGRFTEEAGEFAHLATSAANPKIIEKLHQLGRLLNRPGENIRHSYPHCWRCKKAVLSRATEQWFLSLRHQELRQRALAEIDRVTWIPAWGRDRIYGMVENRPDWCISRQRLWGVPVPAFYCDACGYALITGELVDHVVQQFEKEGADAWFTREVAELMPPGTRCPRCQGTAFRKEDDILDVWFDSGVSWSAVLDGKTRLGIPCDLYLEGNDQYRGWFHSSLLAAVGTRGCAPYRAVLTHGMVVTAEGRKMSKSLGNAISPADTIQRLGAEILRLWVAAEDYREDIRLSEDILKNVAEGYRKIRNTARFLLSNLFDFDPAKHQVPASSLSLFDRWLLQRLGEVTARVRAAFEAYEFHRFFHEILGFCAVDLSAFYLDTQKDRLYCSRADDPARRAAQTVMYRVAEVLAILTAPVMCFTADEIWRHLPGQERAPSVHLADFPAPPAPAAFDPALESEMALLQSVRNRTNEVLEEARREKKIGSSLEAWVTVAAAGEPERQTLRRHEGILADLFITSRVRLVDAQGGLGFSVTWERAPGPRCERCWRYTEEVAAHGEHPALCARCAGVLGLQ